MASTVLTEEYQVGSLDLSVPEEFEDYDRAFKRLLHHTEYVHDIPYGLWNKHTGELLIIGFQGHLYFA